MLINQYLFRFILKKLSDVVKKNVVKKDVDNARTRNTVDKIPNITNLATYTTLNGNIDEVKKTTSINN